MTVMTKKSQGEDSKYIRNLQLLLDLKKEEGETRRAQKLKEELVKTNIPLVLSLLQKINKYKEIDADDVQNGILGLCETINIFNPEKAKSLGALGYYKILHNNDLYKYHPVGIKVPKSKVRDYRFIENEFVEDRQSDVVDGIAKTEMQWVMEQAELILEDEELFIFQLRTSSKITFKALSKELNKERKEVTRIYKEAFNKVVEHCKGIIECH